MSDGSKVSLSLSSSFNESLRMWAIKFRLDNYKSSWYVQSAVQFVASTTPDRSTAQVASVVVVALSRCNCVRVCVCEKLSLSHFRRVSCRLGVVGHISTTSSFMGFWRKTAACGVLYFDFLSFFKGCKCLGRSGFPHVVSEREREKSRKRGKLFVSVGSFHFLGKLSHPAI